MKKHTLYAFQREDFLGRGFSWGGGGEGAVYEKKGLGEGLGQVS